MAEGKEVTTPSKRETVTPHSLLVQGTEFAGDIRRRRRNRDASKGAHQFIIIKENVYFQ
jgi:hypothetical protein